jgi:hypothetical protein
MDGPLLDGDGVRDAVRALAADADPDRWSVGQWRDGRGNPGLASFRRALRWIDVPTLDEHNAIRVPYDAREDGMPRDSFELDALERVGDEIEDLAPTWGVLVGYDTSAGFRTFHVYTDSEDQNRTAAIATWATQKRAQHHSTFDPGWQQVRPFMR